MFKLLSAFLLAAAVVNAAPTPNDPSDLGKKPKPESYAEGYLEDYDVYHCRYIAINCQNQHGTKFWDDCCHPMLATESLEKNRKEYCRPDKHPAPEHQFPACVGVRGAPTPVNPSPSSTPSSGNNDDDEEECDDENDAPAPKPAPAPAPTPAPAPAPAPAPSGDDSNNGGNGGNGGDNGGDSNNGGNGGDNGGNSNNGGGSGGEVTGGYATFYFQNGNAGNCGKVNPDSAYIAALQTQYYYQAGDGGYCGRKILITNTQNGRSVEVEVADQCPSCKNAESIDLSQAAFNAIASESEGMVPISWHWV